MTDKEYSQFTNTLLKNNVVQQSIFKVIPYKGQKMQKRFKLGVSFLKLEEARRKSEGNFVQLIEVLQK